jgi:hypothetical protein
MADIKGINGASLGIDSEIYNDTTNVGNREWLIESIAMGMFDDLDKAEMEELIQDFVLTNAEREKILSSKKDDLSTSDLATDGGLVNPKQGFSKTKEKIKNKKLSAFTYRG